MTADETLSPIRRALLAEIRARRGRPAWPVYDFIFEYGTEFAAAPLPAGMRRARPKQCLKNAERIASKDGSYKYCEGFALTSGHLFEHAWCSRDGMAVDPTLGFRAEAAYIGIVIPRDLHCEEISKNGVLTVLDPAGPNQIFFENWAKSHPKLVALSD